MPNDPSQLVACFVELSTNKERSTLEHSVVKTLSQLLCCELVLLHLHDDRGEFNPEIRFWQPDPTDTKQTATQLSTKPSFNSMGLEQSVNDYLSELEFSTPSALHQQQGKVFWPLNSGERCLDIVIIERRVVTAEELNLLTAFGSIFSNFMELLDAGERDALTGLFNRRVFDTRLDALVHRSSSSQASTTERRIGNTQLYNFLGIIDIDFFKRVNDDFGHLFGDEVLLWLAQQMRHCFRNEDALFRYGGEEFAVLLAGLNRQQAQDTFERFRKTIANTSFPQIGKITVSIGYTNIDAQANPTLVFGEADKALYYAKEHGRDRVNCYPQLIEDGMIGHDKESEDIELF